MPAQHDRKARQTQREQIGISSGAPQAISLTAIPAEVSDVGMRGSGPGGPIWSRKSSAIWGIIGEA
jgi:hypothetical protein